jgi:hypothetical protein
VHQLPDIYDGYFSILQLLCCTVRWSSAGKEVFIGRGAEKDAQVPAGLSS